MFHKFSKTVHVHYHDNLDILQS